MGAENRGTQSIDIQEVHYFSDGNSLNTTLWLLAPLNESLLGRHIPSYGIYIDADSNNNTGFYGVDYQMEISKENGKWTKKIYTYSSLGNSEPLAKEETFNPGIEKNTDYIPLSFNLSMMGFPTKYRLMFYSEEDYENHTQSKMDFTGWIDVPPQQFSLSTTPGDVVISQGESRLFPVELTSDTSLVPSSVNFEVDSKLIKNATNLDMKFVYDRSGTYGAGPSTLLVFAPNNSKLGTYTIPVIAKISKTTLSPISPPTINLPFIPPAQGTESRHMNLHVTVIAPKDISQLLQDFNKAWIEPLSGIYTFLIGLFTGGISQFFYKRITGKKN